ncbi:hypothetical protein Hanom_Chr02g00139631 [Helianthus anomalus]
MGFEWEEGYMMRVTYATYLDVLEYNYKKYKIKEKVNGSETKQDEVGTSTEIHRSRSEDRMHEKRSRMEEANMEAKAYRGSDWRVMKRLGKRKIFDFNQVKKAMSEANNSLPRRPTRY